LQHHPAVARKIHLSQLFRFAQPHGFTLARIGDCEAPAIIAAATYAGHRYAQELDASVDIDLPMPHDKVDVGLIAPAVWSKAAE
jgi:dimethylamine/trimethylamine dehydrogenase